MDLLTFPGSRIITVAREAAAHADVDFLCFGESDVNSPAAARDALKHALDQGHERYPDVRGLPQLRMALAAHLSRLHARPVTESRVQVCASGMSALNIALAATVSPGQRVVLHTPAWPNAGNAARLRGASVTELPLDQAEGGGFTLDLDRLDHALAGARAFILNSPNNPTGWTATRAELETILAITRKHDAWLIADEVYSRLTYDGTDAAPSLLDIASPDDRVIIANSFSKTWAMTGWRLGWMVLPEGAREGIAEIVEVTHSGVAPFAQHGALAAIADEAFVTDFRAHCARGRALAADALGGLNGIRYASPDGAFYAFIGVDGLADSLDFALQLVRGHGVALAPGIAFGAAGEGYLRVCFAQSPARLTRAFSRLRDGLRAR